MIIHCYSIYDNQIDAFPEYPFFARSHGEAIRAFSDLVNATNGPNKISQHPEDYVLFHIGSFNPENGISTQADGGASRLITGRDLIAPKE